jgi:two-component system, NarL family, nitrate/nitrite response regulator NarL
MLRIVIVSPSPLLAEGVSAALQVVDVWDVRVGRAEDDADAWVLLGDEIVVRGAHGAIAQLAADASASRLRAAVGAVLEGLSVRETPWFTDAPDHEPLTPRELQVFELLGKGLSNRDIAGVLGISAHTAKYHVGQILAKVGASTRAEAVSEGLRFGWIGL